MASFGWLLLFLCLSSAGRVYGDPTITELVPGEPLDGSLGAHQYAYFSTAGLHDIHKDLTIAVTPLSGDPDLYVSVTKKYPTLTDYTWSRAHLGGDTVTIPAEDSKACGSKPDCHYYIGVYGYADATFTVLASWSDAEPVRLRQGQPQADHVGAGNYKQFAFNITPSTMQDSGMASDLQVLVNPVVGDSDLYVTLDGSRPLSDNFQYRSASWGDVQDRVVVHRNDSQYLQFCKGGRCLLRASVYGFHDADFTIVVSTYAEQLALQHGVPLESTVPPNTYQRFTAVWSSAVDDLVISLSPLSGQPRIFVSCSPTMPNSTTHEWSLDTARADSNVLRLQTTEASKHGCTLPATVSMAVISDTLSSFSIMASLDASSSVPVLVPGMPLSGQARYGKMTYYQIRLGETYVDVDVILTVRAGEVDLYVSDSYEGRPVYDPTTGKVSNYTISSSNDGDDRVSITHSHFKTCAQGEPCYYIVGVLGSDDARNEYTIVSKKVDSTVTLQDGVAVRDFVGPRMYEYFKVKVVDPEADLTITATPFSGDPDLYVSVPPNYHPTKENHTWASRGFGADTLTLQAEALKQYCTPDPAAGRGCDVYIGVFGWTNTSFSLQANLQMGWTNPSLLFPGQAQAGHVGKGAYQYYEVYIPEDAHSPTISILLTPAEDADQDLYVSMSRDKEPGKSQYDYKATSWELDDQVVITPSMQPYCSGCSVYLAVFGYDEGDYTITVSLSNDQTALQIGVPARGSVTGESAAYYSVDWQSFIDDLMITLSAESGRSYLYASCKDAFPNATAHDWALDTRDGSILRLNGSDGTAHGCQAPTKLWVSVAAAASTLSSYTILASTDASSSVPLLVPGLQVAGDVKYGKMAYYQVRLGKAYVDVGLILTVKAGEVDLYVSDSYEGRPVLDPYQGVVNYTVKSEEPGNDRIEILHSHFKTCEDGSCYYIVALLGKGYGRNEYVIAAKLDDSTVTLHDGIAIRDDVGPHMYEYFKIKVVDPDADLTITSTPFSGDPDLFVALAPNVHPTKENHTWASRGFGADTLTLQAEALKEYCTPDPHAGKGCDVYIGVYGWTNTSFSIMASLNMGWQTPIMLLSGEAQSGHVAKGAYVYYVFYVSDEIDGQPAIKLTLVPTEGADQDLYVSLSHDKEPGKSQYDYKATSWSGVDEVVIRPGMEGYCTGCQVYVAVFGYQEGDYHISASVSSDHTMLQLGVPVQSVLSAGGIDYFAVSWSSAEAEEDLLITLTEGSGVPVLYASCQIAFPNATAHEWVLDTRDDNLLRINVTESKRAGCVGRSVYLSVVSSPDTMATYTLLASADLSSLVPLLVPGVQLQGTVKTGKMTYYQVRLGKSSQDVDVILTVRTGEVDMYVSDSYEGRPVVAEDGTVKNFTQSSDQTGSDRLLIKHSHFATCTVDCYYIIGLLGRGASSASSSFTVVAKRVDSTITLQDGVPIRDVVGPKNYEYYRVTLIDPEADLTISVTPFSGDPDLYVSVPPNYHPTKENHTWASRGFGADTLTLQAEALKQYCTPDPLAAKGCDVLIGVYGWSGNTSFSITASLNMGWLNPTLLFPGQPQTDHVETGAYRYFEFYVSGSADKVRFVLTSDAEGDMDLYLSVSRDKEPGKSQYDLKSTTWAGDDEITFSRAEAGAVFCTDCTVYLSVYGYIGGDFTLSVGGAGFQTLQSAVPVTGHVDAGTAAFYKVFNDNPEAAVEITVTTLSGDPDLYVLRGQGAVDGPMVLPGKDKYDWKGNRVGDDSVEVLPSDPKFCSDCEYLVAVYGWTNTSFTITASVESLFVIPLAPGRPQTGRVSASDLRYFYATLGNSAEDLRVSLTLLTGDAQLFIAEGVDMAKLPTPSDRSSYKYKSQPASGSSLVVTVPGPHVNVTSFAIGVLGLDQSDFTITASLQQTPVMLQEGVPMQQAVNAGKMEYFTYTITSLADITITVTAIQGDPDLVASVVHEKPVCGEPVDDGGDGQWTHTCQNYTWISQAFSSDQLIIRHDLPCKESGTTRVAMDCTPDMVSPGRVLHIGVFGFEYSVFSISLTTGGGHTSLVAGRPQHGITTEGAICRHRTETGSCDTSDGDGTWTMAQVSYFQFHVSADDIDKDSNAHVSIVLEPACNTTITPCAPGCPCNPLTVYVQSCLESSCTVDDMYPSSLSGHHQIAHVADTSHSTLFIAHDPSNPHNGFCDPRVHGSNHVCNYYIAVTHKDSEREASFSISASTPKDVTVLPTRSHPAPPDGIVTSSLDAVRGKSKKYQMYADRGSSMLLSLEACTGELSLAVCDGSCPQLYPTSRDYKYYADTTKTCTRAGCTPSVSAMPRIALDKVADDTYFVAVEGSGTYYLRVETSASGTNLAPILAAPTTGRVPAISDVKADSVTVSWKPAELFTAGGTGTRVTPQRTKYRIYALDDKMLSEALRQQGEARPSVATSCGLEHYAASQTGMGAKVAVTDEGRTSHTMQGLSPGVSYRFLVVAVCDADCLRQVSKVTPSTTLPLSCGGSVPCQSQTALYGATTVQTTMSAGGGGAGKPSSRLSSTFISLLVVVLVVTLVGMGLLYRKNRRLEQQLQYEMTDTTNFTSPVTSRRPASLGSTSSSSFLIRPAKGKTGGKSYQPLLDNEVDDSYTLHQDLLENSDSSIV